MQENNNQPFDIRTTLYNEVGAILKAQKYLEKLESIASLFNEIELLFKNDDLYYIRDNSYMIRMILESILSKEKVSDYYESLIVSINNVINLKENNLEYTKDYQDELTKLYINKKAFSELSETLNARKEVYKKKVDSVKEILILCRRILSNIKYGNVVSERESQLIEILMEREHVSVEDQIKTKEFIRIHNLSVIHPEIPPAITVDRMLKDKCEKIDIDNELNIKYGDELKNYIISVYSSVKKNDNSYIEFLQEIREYYNKEEYLYILANVINLLIDERKNSIDEMKEMYDDEDLRKVTIATYREVFDKTVNVYGLYNKVRLEKDKQESIINLDKKTQEDEEIKTNIYFAINEQGEALIEKDLKNIREEKLEELADLIKGKKYGKLMQDEDQQLVNNNKFRQFRELRGDQVRIIYRNLNGNNILITGAFIKKDDNDRLNYNNITKRVSDSTVKWYSDNIDKIKETSNEAYERIAKYVSDNKRMGTR